MTCKISTVYYFILKNHIEMHISEFMMELAKTVKVDLT